VKVKCTLVQALRLCIAHMAHRGTRYIALPFHDHGTRRGEGSALRPGCSLPPGRPGTHCTEGWLGPRAGLAGAENLAPTGIFFVQWFYCSIQSMSYICLADGQLWDTVIEQLVLQTLHIS
jgi:hypothetical protein